MPIIRRSINAAGTSYAPPFVGEAEYPVMVPVNISTLTTAEVDQYGYIKPGVPLSAAGALVGAAVAVYGVVPEAVRVAASNSTADMTAAGTVDVTVIVMGVVNRHLIEANLARALNANEIAGFGLAGCRVVLAQ
jgi:hypothetical protein